MSPLLKKLQAVKTQPKLDNVPSSHRTRDQWGQVWGLGRSRTTALLKIGIESNLMKMTRYRVKGMGGGVCMIPHYYEVKKGGKK